MDIEWELALLEAPVEEGDVLTPAQREAIKAASAAYAEAWGYDYDPRTMRYLPPAGE